MARKHPWMAMKQGLADWRRSRWNADTAPVHQVSEEMRARLLAAGQPDHRDHDGRAVDPQHDERGDLERGGDIERQLGEPERADNRNQKYEPHSKNNRK